MSSLVSAADSMDWDEYLRWLTSTKHRHYGRNLWLLGKKVYRMAFTPELILMEHTRRKEDILKAISNICRFLDIKHDTYFHEQFLGWLKRKEVRWKRARGPYENYALAETLTISRVAKNIRALPPKYTLFATFALVSGLRTEEAVRAFNDHLQLCNGRVIEMFWDRRTKKANAVFCHPILHKKISMKISYNSIHRHLHSRILGCQLRHLRKLNYTMVATRIDPLLAEFMQGRRGNISQRHYYLPLMRSSYQRWIRMWDPYVSRL
ncbi:MAG: integrase [Candidatus Nitrosotenuis sp.]